MDRIIFHVDVNSAYLSWSAIKILKEGGELDIRTVPAIVGGDRESRHGVVLAKSIPAKRFNVKTGEPVASALKKCATLEMVPPDHDYYEKQSQAFVEILKEYASHIEQVSIDECYVDFTDVIHYFKKDGKVMTPVQAAVMIKDEIYKRLGFTVNIGISSNKILAKMASDFKKPNLVHTLFPEEIERKMWSMPVNELYMVGKASAGVLHNLDIKTIGQLAKTPVEVLESHLKSHGRAIWEFANGIDDSIVNGETEQLKGVGNSTTLPSDVTDAPGAKKILLWLAEKVASRLREYEQKCAMVSVEIKYNDFSRVSHQETLTAATNSSHIIYETSCRLFDELWNGTPVRLLGIRTSKLEDLDEPEQMTIFDILPSTTKSGKRQMTKSDKQEKIDEAVDKINEKYGKKTIMRAGLLFPDKEEDA